MHNNKSLSNVYRRFFGIPSYLKNSKDEKREDSCIHVMIWNILRTLQIVSCAMADLS